MTAAIIATICIAAVLGLRHLRARQAAREHLLRRVQEWTR